MFSYLFRLDHVQCKCNVFIGLGKIQTTASKWFRSTHTASPSKNTQKMASRVFVCLYLVRLDNGLEEHWQIHCFQSTYRKSSQVSIQIEGSAWISMMPAWDSILSEHSHKPDHLIHTGRNCGILLFERHALESQEQCLMVEYLVPIIQTKNRTLDWPKGSRSITEESNTMAFAMVMPIWRHSGKFEIISTSSHAVWWQVNLGRWVMVLVHHTYENLRAHLPIQ